jgi:hypothetical protein
MKNITNFNLFNESSENLPFPGSEERKIRNEEETKIEIEGLRQKVNQKNLPLFDLMIKKIESNRQGGKVKASDLLTILETFNLLGRGEKKPQEILAINGILNRLYPGFNDSDSQLYNNEKSQYTSDRVLDIVSRNLRDYKESLVGMEELKMRQSKL